ncbi:MAG: HAD family phosphatase [Parasporobacterium sp.]|nr:HAD family phosphatase [Parasporobacterium sp.]
MKLPELMIFDMDGLLFDTERMFMNLRASVLPKYGYVHKEEDYLRTVGVSGTLLFEILEDIYGPDYPKEKVTADTRALQKEYVKEHGLEPKPGIKALLDWAKAQGITCCVASSSQSVYVEEFLNAGGIRNYFSFIIGGDFVTLTKPNPEIFLLACAHEKTEPSEALVLEDSENGVLAAINGKIPVVCIPDLKVPAPEVLAKAAAVFKTADEVIDWLSNH